MTQSLRHKLIFYGKTVDATRRKICIKFVKQYSAGAHRFCARKGHAPKLLSYKCLPGGWKKVVMDVLDINPEDEHVLQRTGSYRKFREMDFSDFRPLKKAVTDFIHEFHAEGYIHGDLRDVNMFARDGGEGVTTDGFMLLDFDWAGKIGETHYPMHVNLAGYFSS